MAEDPHVLGEAGQGLRLGDDPGLLGAGDEVVDEDPEPAAGPRAEVGDDAGEVVDTVHELDDLAGIIAEFRPGPGRRLGVLVDHLVPGTKEARIVAEAQALPGLTQYARILGHPYVDVWQSVRPERLGWQRWPVIPRSTSWKHGICAELGWAHETQADIANAWKRILGTVRSYADLEPTLLASVEELIDFVTDPGA